MAAQAIEAMTVLQVTDTSLRLGGGVTINVINSERRGKPIHNLDEYDDVIASLAAEPTPEIGSSFRARRPIAETIPQQGTVS